MDAKSLQQDVGEALIGFIAAYENSLTDYYRRRFSGGNRTTDASHGAKKRRPARKNMPGFKLELHPHQQYLSQVVVTFTCDDPDLFAATMNYLLGALAHTNEIHAGGKSIRFAYAAFGTNAEAIARFARP